MSPRMPLLSVVHQRLFTDSLQLVRHPCFSRFYRCSHHPNSNPYNANVPGNVLKTPHSFASESTFRGKPGCSCVSYLLGCAAGLCS